MTDNASLRSRYRSFRKRVLSLTPFVKRRRHEKVVAGLTQHLTGERDRERELKEALGHLFLMRPPLGATARFAMRAPVMSTAVDEMCFFVTHAAQPEIKQHVVDHVEALLASGIAVLLIVNTDLDFSSVRIPSELLARLHGCIVRENVGYDFGAWAHAHAIAGAQAARRRLYLINDSIIGPLDRQKYRELLERVRTTRADFIGMTCNPEPRDHLQSYYLVLNERLLRSAVWEEFMGNVVNLPRKEIVIECYEVWLTSWFERAGFTRASMFPTLRTDPALSRNDTIWSWRQLVDLGFPFIKSGVLSRADMADEARQIIPPHYLTSASAPMALGNIADSNNNSSGTGHGTKNEALL